MTIVLRTFICLLLMVTICDTIEASINNFGIASWYDSESACAFNPNPKCPTASGRSLYELERNGERFAAMWGVPFGTNLRVTNLANGKSTRVTVQDRGPARRLNRTIDLSKKAFSDIAEIDQGLIPVSVEALRD